MQKYNLTARILHWVSAAIILWATVSGLYASSIGTHTHQSTLIIELNISLTTIFIPIFVWRAAHRLYHGTPSYESLSAHEIRIASLMHSLIYLLTLIVLVSGVLMMQEEFKIFNTITIPNVISNQSLTKNFEMLHIYTSRFLGICIAAHILAVAMQHKRGVNIIARMI